MGRTERARTLDGIHVGGPFAWLMMLQLKTIETRVNKEKHPEHLGKLPSGSIVLLHMSTKPWPPGKGAAEKGLHYVTKKGGDLQYSSYKGGRSAIFE